MRFNALLLEYEGLRPANLDDLKAVHEKHSEVYQPEGQKNLYVVDTAIIEDRFFWLACEYDDAARFRDYVVNSDTGERQPNPRTQNQVEPRQQFFACYDNKRQRLFISSLQLRSTFRRILVESSQKEFQIRNIYTSLDEFCARIKTIKGFSFTQVDNIFARNNDLFKQISTYGGLDLPKQLKLNVSYADTPVSKSRALIDRLKRDKDAFEHVIIIGADDTGIEQTFDFSSIIERMEIDVQKDATEHYDPQEVKTMLLAKLR